MKNLRVRYVELHCKSNFSFLEGASHAHELMATAKELNYAGIAITDRDTLAGIVRAHTAAKDGEIPFYVGCEINPIDGPPVVLWPKNRQGYADLCKLLSLGRLRSAKGFSTLSWHDLANHSSECIAGLIPSLPAGRPSTVLGWGPPETSESTEPLPNQTQASTSPNPTSQFLPDHNRSDSISLTPIPLEPWCTAGTRFDPYDEQPWIQWLCAFRELFADRAYLLAHLHLGPHDAQRLELLARWSNLSSVPLVAAGGSLYHHPHRMVLHDCLQAIATGSTIEQVASFRPANAQYALRSIEQIATLYQTVPDAILRTEQIASELNFRLDSLRYEYPTEWAPEGMSAIDYLKQLTWQGAKSRYPNGVPMRIVEMLRHEIRLIEELHYEAYFLTVWDIVRFARSRNILCQGRGSAANSAVCYCLGVTSVDPSCYDLLFERFISRERNEAPDIDVDFEHQRREEVIQYVYAKYGRERAGMTAAVTTYRTRSAARECAKALGWSNDHIDSLAKVLDGRGGKESLSENLSVRLQQIGIDPNSQSAKRFLYLVESILGFPRHLSQHTGGMVMTNGKLWELCPIENASMQDRTIIQWDKDDLDELGILKVDCLALGMLSALHRAMDLIESHFQRPLSLASIPPDDSQVYDMICNADTVGVFQIESRAQMSMLPRLRPRCFYDLVIEVAIVRPGPIQGNMVHPYLTARQSGIQPPYPSEAIAQVLRKTMGVPIFQEQAMRLAVAAADFTPGEADQLRRAMAAWRRPGVIDQFKRKLIDGMLKKGLNEEFAQTVFHQIRGFGEYGFPESHAASFALLVYASCWIKYHYPQAFCCALLNSQPLGFYSPAQLISDAQRHAVGIAPVDVNTSTWDSTLEPTENLTANPTSFRIRLGLQLIRGLHESDAQLLVEERNRNGIFTDQSELVRRCKFSQATLTILADSGALASLSGNRRAAYWQALGQDKKHTSLPLLEAAGADVDDPIPDSLAPMNPMEEVATDYATLGLSLQGHPMQFYRDQLRPLRVRTANELPALNHGQFVRVAGLIVLRQRPGTAKGITFVTMEDETGSINLVIQPRTWESHYLVCKQSNAWMVHGTLENRKGVIHVVVGRIDDLTNSLGPIDWRSRDFR